MRLFIAIGCPDGVKERIHSIAAEVLCCGDMKAVEYENLHLTVKYLGEVEAAKAQNVIDALKSVRHPAFNVSVRGLGCFPKPSHPRVVWAGVDEGFNEVSSLHQKIDEVLKPLRFPPDDNFHPHLTLARVRGRVDTQKLKALLDSKKDLLFGSYAVGGFTLMESTLTPGGPIYRTVSNLPLG